MRQRTDMPAGGMSLLISERPCVGCVTSARRFLRERQVTRHDSSHATCKVSKTLNVHRKVQLSYPKYTSKSKVVL